MRDEADGRPGLAVVTGASSGIGAALAVALGRRGFDLVLVARRLPLLEQVAARARAAGRGIAVRAVQLDVTEAGAAEQLVALAPEARLVINNAGFGLVGRAVEIADADYRRMIALNVTALTSITLAFARRMADGGGGTVQNIASMAGMMPLPYQAVYAATKAFVISLSEGIHHELRGRGVRVLAYCPGPTLTESNDAGVGKALAKGRGAFFLTAEQVAEDAVRAALLGRESAVPGPLNRLLALLAALLPRPWVRAVMARVYAAQLQDEGA